MRRIQGYLQHAKANEDFAAAAVDPRLRSDFLRIAEGWRLLARQAEMLATPGWRAPTTSRAQA